MADLFVQYKPYKIDWRTKSQKPYGVFLMGSGHLASFKTMAAAKAYMEKRKQNDL